MRPITVSIEDFTIRIPSPEALMLHKLIIAQRRTGRDKEFKKEKDLQQCLVLADVVRREETLQIATEYRLSKDVKKSIHESCEAIGIPDTRDATPIATPAGKASHDSPMHPALAVLSPADRSALLPFH